MAKNLIGHTDCPHCGDKNAEVGLDKKGNPYSYCMSATCEGLQLFTHGKAGRAKTLLKRTRFVAGYDAAALCKKFGVELQAAPAPTGDEPAPKPAAKPGGFGFFRAG